MPYLSDEEMARAREMDLLTYLQRYEPQNLKSDGPNTYRMIEYDSLVINNGMWYRHSRELGGASALDFMVKVRGMAYYDAALFMLDLEGRAPVKYAPRQQREEQKEKPQNSFVLPPVHTDNKRVIAYLTSRGIDRAIIDYCIETGTFYESVRGKYHNCVFVGRDETGKARFAAQRGTDDDFKRDVSGSDKRYNFAIHPDKQATCLCVFESSIDAMSYASLIHKVDPGAWKRARYLSLGGVSSLALEQYLKTHSNIGEIVFMLDNDEAGRTATAKIKVNLEMQDRYVTDRHPAQGKDYNEELRIRLPLLLKRPQKQIRPKDRADFVR